MVVVRGDHRVNDIKLRQRARRAVPARPARTRSRRGSARRLHRPGRRERARSCSTTPSRRRRLRRGRQPPDYHLRGVEPGRDFPFERADVRTVEAGDTVDGHPITHRAGDRGRQHLQARHALLRAARRHVPRRAAASEQLDLDGLLRDRPGAHRRRGGRAVRRRAGHLVAARARAVGRRARRRWASPARPSARPPRRCTRELRDVGVDVLLDDRDAGPGEKFADAELLGCPLRLTVGRRTLESGARSRCRCAAGARTTRRRAAGGRRRGGGRAVAEPPVERSEPPGSTVPAPDAAWTARAPPPPADAGRRAAATRGRSPTRSASCALALIPVFLVARALQPTTGPTPLPAVLFAVIAWGDYADGIAARVTGQYSRLGALLDPVVDRLLVISGVVVCWHFELLPRWALAVLVARELLMLVARRARAAPRRRAARSTGRAAGRSGR